MKHSVQLVSHSALSDSWLWPHRLQHTRPPCPSPTPRACSNSCASSQWCHPTISSSVIPFSSCPLSFQHQGLSQWVSSSHQAAKVLEFQLQFHSFQWIFRTDFLQDGLVGSPCSPRDSQEFSPTPQFKSINSTGSAFFVVQLSHPYMTTGKTIALTRQPFVGKVMSLLFNILGWSQWESQFLGRLIRSPGSPRRRKGSGALEVQIGVWNSQGGGKDKHFFSPHSLVLAQNWWLYNKQLSLNSVLRII